MRGKERNRKIHEALSKGVVALVFLMLAVQFAFFIVRAADSCTRQVAAVSSSADSAVTVPAAGIPSARDSVMRQQLPEAIPDVGRKPAPAVIPGTGSDLGDNIHISCRRQEPEAVEYVYDGWKWDNVELNSADSAALVGLPGIGPYYARKILQYRERLWGSFASVYQLLEIRGIDTSLMALIKDMIYIEPSSVRYIDLSSLSLDSMSAHPYIGPYAAKGIDRYRRMKGGGRIDVDELVSNGIVRESSARRLKLYIREYENIL